MYHTAPIAAATRPTNSGVGTVSRLDDVLFLDFFLLDGIIV
jgi:hypothetical protein